MTRKNSKQIALIGNGAIAHEIIRQIENSKQLYIVGALVLPEELRDISPHPLVATIDELLQWKPSLIVECAGHAAVRDYASSILKSGIDFMIISIGALSDAALHEHVTKEVTKSPAQVYLPAGALLGIDGLAATKLAGLDWVRLTSRKPPLAWSSAPGVEAIDLEAISSEQVIFSGSARDAARLFPKNANVAATVAIAGIGFDKTEVNLVADPKAQRNSHLLEFEGRPGRYRVETQGLASPENPKTSMLTAYNILRSIQNLEAPIVI